jgi:hypothetical protein
MLITAFVSLTTSNNVEKIIPINTIVEPKKVFVENSIAYPNTDISSLWVRRNGSDPGFPFPNPNQTPISGMDYFGTRVIQTGTSYSISDLENPNLFPSNAIIYPLVVMGSLEYVNQIASLAVTDHRIKGMWVDDFNVGKESPANMSAMYSAIHSQDANLPEPLTFGITFYQKDYYKQTPYNWSSISSYFDIVQFWFYPKNYGLLFPEFAGYRDDFLSMRVLIPDKEYWLGIYVYWYAMGYYPTNFTNDQMSIGCKLIKEGKASRFTILENFWIQHFPITAEIIRDYLDLYHQNYSTVWYNEQSIVSYQGDTILNYNLTSDIKYLYGFYTFKSLQLQTLIIHYVVAGIVFDNNLKIVNTRTGEYDNTYFYDINNGTYYWILEANQIYRLMTYQTDFAHVIHIDNNYWINSTEFWTDSTYWINGTVYVNDEFSIQRCLIIFGNNHYNDSVYNFTTPKFGFIFGAKDELHFALQDSIITGENKAYSYLFSRTFLYEGLDQSWYLTYSVIACNWGTFRPAGTVIINSCTFYSSQPDSGNTHSSIWLEAGSNYLHYLLFEDSLIWNYDYYGANGLFLYPCNILIPGINYKVDNMTIIGGNWGVWMDADYSLTGQTYVTNLTCHTQSNNGLFITFRVDSISPKEMIVTTQTIWDWSVKGGLNDRAIFTLIHTNLQNGLYEVTSDFQIVDYAVTTNLISIKYNGAWLPNRNNFTLRYFGANYVDSGISFANLLYLIIIYLPAMLMVQAIPRIGFIGGMVLMLIVFGLAISSFLPYMFMGLIVIGIAMYKGKI